MLGILIFAILVFLVSVAFRFLGSKYYDKIYGKENDIERLQLNSPALSTDNLLEDDELVAVITAAASEVLKKRIIVRKIKSINPNMESAWSQAGRTSVMGSHSLKINS